MVWSQLLARQGCADEEKSARPKLQKVGKVFRAACLNVSLYIIPADNGCCGVTDFLEGARVCVYRRWVPMVVVEGNVSTKRSANPVAYAGLYREGWAVGGFERVRDAFATSSASTGTPATKIAPCVTR